MLSNSGLPYTVWSFFLALMLVTIWHELGHLFAARRHRVPVKLIAVGFGPALWRRVVDDDLRLELRALPLGMAVGVIGRRDAQGRDRRPVDHDLAMAAGGPLASLLLAGLLTVLSLAAMRTWPGLDLGSWLLATGLLSLLLAVLNLAPIPGLDGGHLLVLGLARFGHQLAPRSEVRLHRTGMQIMMALCIAALAVSLLGGM